jgi:hypothetical protein
MFCFSSGGFLMRTKVAVVFGLMALLFIAATDAEAFGKRCGRGGGGGGATYVDATGCGATLTYTYAPPVTVTYAAPTCATVTYAAPVDSCGNSVGGRRRLFRRGGGGATVYYVAPSDNGDNGGNGNGNGNGNGKNGNGALPPGVLKGTDTTGNPVYFVPISGSPGTYSISPTPPTSLPPPTKNGDPGKKLPTGPKDDPSR